MKFGPLFGWGIVIYAVMRLASQGLVTYGFSGSFLPVVIEIVALVILCTVAGRSLRFGNWKDIIPYSIVWAIEAIVLNGIFFVPFFGWQAYADLNAWVDYILIAILPLLAPLSRRRAHELSPINQPL